MRVRISSDQLEIVARGVALLRLTMASAHDTALRADMYAQCCEEMARAARAAALVARQRGLGSPALPAPVAPPRVSVAPGAAVPIRELAGVSKRAQGNGATQGFVWVNFDFLLTVWSS